MELGSIILRKLYKKLDLYGASINMRQAQLDNGEGEEEEEEEEEEEDEDEDEDEDEEEDEDEGEDVEVDTPGEDEEEEGKFLYTEGLKAAALGICCKRLTCHSTCQCEMTTGKNLRQALIHLYIGTILRQLKQLKG